VLTIQLSYITFYIIYKCIYTYIYIYTFIYTNEESGELRAGSRDKVHLNGRKRPNKYQPLFKAEFKVML